MSLKACDDCHKAISKKAPNCPHCGSPQNISMQNFSQQKKQPPNSSRFSTLFIIALVVFGIFNFTLLKKTSTSTSASTSTSISISQRAVTPSVSPRTYMPKDQIEFIKVIDQHVDLYYRAPNELQKSAARSARKTAISSQLGGKRSIYNWVGEIKRLGTTSASPNDKAYLSIKISPDIDIKTWNNSFSDTSDNTLIAMDSVMYKKLSKLKRGQLVKFSGRFVSDSKDFIKESSLTNNGSMNSPEFILKFTDISPVN